MVLLCSSVSQRLMGQPLLFSCQCWRVGREAMVMAPPAMHDSAVSPCFHGCLAFLHRHFPSRWPPSHPLNSSCCSQQQPSLWDCSTIPKLQLPAAVPSRRPLFLSGVCMATARTVWFWFHLGCHRSAVSLSALNVSPLTQTIALLWWSDPCFSSPPTEGRSSPTNAPVFFPYFLCSTEVCMVLYILFHWPSTPVCSQLVFWMYSVSEGVFLMYLWREMYSTSTYSSAISFFLLSILKCVHYLFTCRSS